MTELEDEVPALEALLMIQLHQTRALAATKRGLSMVASYPAPNIRVAAPTWRFHSVVVSP